MDPRGGRLLLLRLQALSFLPADEGIKVADEEGEEADGHGNIARLREACDPPQKDQNGVVTGVGKREIGTAALGKIDRREARRDRERARNQMGGAEIFERKEEQKRHERRQKKQ